MYLPTYIYIYLVYVTRPYSRHCGTENASPTTKNEERDAREEKKLSYVFVTDI